MLLQRHASVTSTLTKCPSPYGADVGYYAWREAVIIARTGSSTYLERRTVKNERRRMQLIPISTGPERTGAVRPAGGEVNLDIFRQMPEAEPAWRGFEAHAEHYVFQTFDWLHAWQKCVGEREGIRPAIVVIRASAGVPAMLLPLGLAQRGGITRLGWLGGRITDYHGPLLAPDWRAMLNGRPFAGIWAAVRRRLPAHDLVFLEKQPERIGSQPNPFLELPCVPHPSNAHHATLSGSYNAFLDSHRSADSRRRDRSRERRLAQLGALNFRVAHDPADARHIAAVMLRQKSLALHRLGAYDLCGDSGHRDLMEQLCAHHTSSGLVQFRALEIGAHIVATMFGLTYRGRYYGLMRSYDPAYARYSPGTLLQHRLIEWCAANAIHTVDFTIGDEDYKNAWCDQELRMYDCIQATSARGHLIAPAVRLERELKRRIKQSPRLFGIARALRARAAVLRTGPVARDTGGTHG